MLTKKKRTIFLVVIAAVALLVVLIPFLVMKISKAFTAQEQAVRTDWSFDTGNVVDQSAEWNVDITQANLGDGLNALQLVPQDIQSEGFTYYDLGVQQRLHQVIEELKSLNDVTWSASQPLTILNPYGTGSNGLYFYFETEVEAKINYTIHVPDSDVPDYTAQAADISGEEYSKTHEFQMIGLVPGEINEVTPRPRNSWDGRWSSLNNTSRCSRMSFQISRHSRMRTGRRRMAQPRTVQWERDRLCPSRERRICRNTPLAEDKIKGQRSTVIWLESSG